MYTLLYGLYKYIVQKDEYCVLILGLDNAGKTVSSYTKTCFRGHLTITEIVIVLHIFSLNWPPHNSFSDVSRGCKDKVYKELQGNEAKQNYNHSRIEYWQD